VRRELAEWAQQAHAHSQRRVAKLIPIERMTLRYEAHRDPQEALRIRLRELAGNRVRYGYRRLTVLLRREGWAVGSGANIQGRSGRVVFLESEEGW
jgi:putative transposase